MMNLGGFYSDSGKYDRATIAFQHALEIDPTSAQAFFSLAQAEQATFDFASATRDYQHALKLAPNEAGMRRTYDTFRRRVEQARKPPPGG
jgi:Tfp pilus assembly protein PilF